MKVKLNRSSLKLAWPLTLMVLIIPFFQNCAGQGFRGFDEASLLGAKDLECSSGEYLDEQSGSCISVEDPGEDPGKQIDGICGSSHGQTVTSSPVENLCSMGQATAPVFDSATSSYKWTCEGAGGGTRSSCMALVFVPGFTTGAIFTVSAPTSAIVGTPVLISVTRTVANGGAPGNDVLTLRSSLAGVTFNPAVLSFTAAQGAGAVTATSTVTFSGAGSAVISFDGSGNSSVLTSGVITVSSGCAGIASFPILNSAPYPTLPTNGIALNAKLFEDSEGYAVGSVAFVAGSEVPSKGYWLGQYHEAPFGSRAMLYSAISSCPGDLRGADVGGGSVEDGRCRRDASLDGPIMSTKADTRFCKLVPGQTYYLNMKSKNRVGFGTVGFILSID